MHVHRCTLESELAGVDLVARQQLFWSVVTVCAHGSGQRGTMAGPAVSFHTLRLTYFDGPGRADPVRWALRFAGIEFEDERLSLAEWDEMRESGERDVPLHQLPLLTVNTVV